jgi:hypothetical protein
MKPGGYPYPGYTTTNVVYHLPDCRSRIHLGRTPFGHIDRRVVRFVHAIGGHCLQQQRGLFPRTKPSVAAR